MAIKKTVYTVGHDQISQTVFNRVDTDGDGTLESTDDWDDGEVHYFGTDGHGRVRALYDLAAAVVQDASNVAQIFHFDAHGNLLNFAGATPLTSYLYSSEAFDHNIGQQYFRARWYDPISGRFNRLDPFFGNLSDPQSLHKYLYVHGDPVNGIDPTGLYSATQTGSALSIGISRLGKLASAVGTVFSAYNTYLTVQNIVQTATQIANGDIGAIVKEIQKLRGLWQNATAFETIDDVRNFSDIEFWKASADSFARNTIRLISEITKSGIAAKLPFVFLNRKSRIVIQLPTPRGLNLRLGRPIVIPGRVQLGVLRVKLAIQVGARKGVGGRVLGIAVQKQKGAEVKSILRQDFHKWDGISPRQKDIRWQEASSHPKFKFHYHVTPSYFENVSKKKK